MADGAFTVKLDAETTARLRRAAELAGQSPEDYAAEALASALVEGQDGGVPEQAAEAMRRLADYDRTGAFVDGDLALDRFVARVEAQAARRP